MGCRCRSKLHLTSPTFAVADNEQSRMSRIRSNHPAWDEEECDSRGTHRNTDRNRSSAGFNLGVPAARAGDEQEHS